MFISLDFPPFSLLVSKPEQEVSTWRTVNQGQTYKDCVNNRQAHIDKENILITFHNPAIPFPLFACLTPISMAPKALLLLLLLCLMRTLLSTFVSSAPTKSTGVNPFACSDRSKRTCTSLLYQHNNLQKEQIASFYSVNGSQIAPISHGHEENFLVSVPCSCQEANGAAGVTVGYFYNTVYKMQDNESSADVASKIYSGQAWEVGSYDPGEKVPMHLMCGCAESDSQIIVTYTVQRFDTLSDIATLLSARTSEIQRLNKILMEDSRFIDVGWVLFVPMEKNGIPRPNSGNGPKYCIIIICILAAAALLSVGTLAIILVGRYRNRRNIKEDPKAVLKRKYTSKSFHSQSQYLHEEKMEGSVIKSRQKET